MTCNLSQGIIEKAVVKVTIKYIRTLSKKLGITYEQAMFYLGLTEEEQKKYLDLLENQS